MTSLTEADMRIRIFGNALPWMGAVLCLLSGAWAADTVVESRWASEPLRVDGIATEWIQTVMSQQKNLSIEYAFKNDARNLYGVFLFKDPGYLSSIEMTGITLYFGPAGKKQKDFGVRFLRKNATADELIGMLEKQGQALTEEKKTEIKAKPMYFLFETDAVNKKGDTIPPPETQGNADPPVFRIARGQDGSMVYEFRVPLASRDVHPAGVGSRPGESIKLGFEWGGMTKEMRAAMMGRGDMPDQSRVSTEDARGERAENESAGSSPSLARSAQGPKQYSFWVDLKLAQAPTQ
jgi:hypothetical protein